MALFNSLLQPRITDTGAAPADSPGQLPGEDPKPGQGPALEMAEEGAAGAPSKDESAARQPGYAVLVPCRTAMRGRFPLNGTYFQVNEVFLDETSLRSPIQVHSCPLLLSLVVLHTMQKLPSSGCWGCAILQVSIGGL